MTSDYKLRFPLKDVQIEINDQKKEVKEPLYDDGFFRLNQNEFSMNVDKVGWFYASGGNYISLVPYPGAAQPEIELFLNGSTYGAILHQRKIMPMHGSCFVYKDQGVMLCGESGAGKSSLTAAFCKNGAAFLTDDVTPIVFSEDKPFILPLSDRIKLWDDSLEQLEEEKHGLDKIDPETEKYYWMLENKAIKHQLHHILLLEIHDQPDVIFREISGAEKVTALRMEIYRPEYLQGMPDNERFYFTKLVEISRNIRITKVLRPEESSIEQTKGRIVDYLAKV